MQPKRTQISVPRDEAGRLIDSGQWRAVGVTHWHLVRTEWRMSDLDRFDNDRVARVRRQQPSHGIARGPHDVADWMMTQRLTSQEAWLVRPPEDWAIAEEISFWFAMRGHSCAGLARLSDEWIAHIDAYAMTAAECGCDQP